MKKKFNIKIFEFRCSVCGSKNVEEIYINRDEPDNRRVVSKHFEICHDCGSTLSDEDILSYDEMGIED